MDNLEQKAYDYINANHWNLQRQMTADEFRNAHAWTVCYEVIREGTLTALVGFVTDPTGTHGVYANAFYDIERGAACNV